MNSEHSQIFPSHEKCVGALADTLVRMERLEAGGRENLVSVIGFLFATQARMPDYLRIAFRILTLVFDAWPYAVTGKPFHRLDLARRIDQVERWNQSRLAFRQGLVTFYRSFVMFALFSELSKQDVDSGVRAKQE